MGERHAYCCTRHELAAEAAVLLAAAAAVGCWAQRTPVMTAVIAALLAGRFALLYRRGDVSIFLAGVLLGGGNDLMSMFWGVYRYTPDALLPLPIPEWMLLLWGEIFLGFRRLLRIPAMIPPQHSPSAAAPLWIDLALYVLLRSVLYRTAAVPWLPDAVYAALFALRLLVAPPPRHQRRAILAMLALGPPYEILLVAAGLYVYQNGTVFGLPLWLLVWWAFIIRLLKDLLDRIEAAWAA